MSNFSAPWLRQARSVTALAAVVLVLAAGVRTASSQPIAPASDPARQALVGRWFGEDYQPTTGQMTKWLMDRRADGTFTVVFKGPPPARPSTETGTWTRRGSTYSTRTITVNGAAT